MIKAFAILVLSLSITTYSFAQSVLIDKNEGAFIVDAGLGVAEKANVFSLGVGGAYGELVDAGFAVGRVQSEFDGAWSIGQGFSINPLRENVGWSSWYISFNESFSMVETSRTLSLGFTFTHKIRIESESSIGYAVGYRWIKPLNSDLRTANGFVLNLFLSMKDRTRLVYLSPYLTYTDYNTVTYGFSFGVGFLQKKPRESE